MLKRKFIGLIFLLIFGSLLSFSCCGNKYKTESKIYILSENDFAAYVETNGTNEISGATLKKAGESSQSNLETAKKYYILVYVYHQDIAEAKLSVSGKAAVSLDETVFTGTSGEGKLSVSENQSEPSVIALERAQGGRENYHIAVGITVNSVEDGGEDYQKPNISITLNYQCYDGRDGLKEYSVIGEATAAYSKQVTSVMSVNYLSETGDNYEMPSVDGKPCIYPYEKMYFDVKCDLSSDIKVEDAGTAVLTVSAKTLNGASVDLVVDDIPSSEYTEENGEIKVSFKVYDSGVNGKSYNFIFYLLPRTNVGVVTLSVSLSGENISIYGDKAVKESFSVSEEMRIESKLQYTLSDNGAYYVVTGIGGEAGDRIRIPAMHKGLKVVAIDKNAFKDEKHIKEVILPDTITRIDTSAFNGCTSLQSIVIPKSVSTMGQYAFYNCPELVISCETERGYHNWNTKSDWKNYNTSVFWQSDYIFRLSPDKKTYEFYCDTLHFKNVCGITRLVIPETYIGYPISRVVYYGTTEQDTIMSIKIPSSVTKIDSDAFSYYYGLYEITVAEGNPVYKSVNNCLIEKATKKLIVGSNNSVIPNDGSVEIIGTRAFWNRDGLRRITLPETVKKIEAEAFSSCNELTSITVPISVSYIGPSAFQGCRKLTSVTVPVSVTDIGAEAFYFCTALTSIKYTGSEEQWRSITKGVDWDTYDDFGEVKKIGYTITYNYTGE